MYTTKGIDAIATITELRTSTSELVELVRETGGAVLIQKNNDPFAVLLDWATYQELVGGEQEMHGEPDRAPKRRGRTKGSSEGEVVG